MLEREQLKDLIHEPKLSKLDILLLALAVDAEKPKKVVEIRELVVSSGLRKAIPWNISYVLSASKGLAIRTPKGWELHEKGKKHLEVNFGVGTKDKNIVNTAKKLRAAVKDISNQDTRNFLDEAIACFELDKNRAAVVLSWVGAVSLLHGHVVNNHLAAFNAEAIRVNSRWRPAKTSDDLRQMRESEFLDTLVRLSIIGGDVKKELKICLDLRNSCGHPNSLQIGENRVAAHIETLILNVFSKF